MPIATVGAVTRRALSHALAGPFASTMLAGYAADVIKIGSPDTGDLGCAWSSPFYAPESAGFSGAAGRP